MKTKLTFQLIKYIVILFFIYFILVYFNILPNNKINNENNNETNINKLEAVCPLTVFNPNKLSVNDIINKELPKPNNSNVKISKIHYCSVKENTNKKMTDQCMLGNIYLDIEKSNNSL